MRRDWHLDPVVRRPAAKHSGGLARCGEEGVAPLVAGGVVLVAEVEAPARVVTVAESDELQTAQSFGHQDVLEGEDTRVFAYARGVGELVDSHQLHQRYPVLEIPVFDSQ